MNAKLDVNPQTLPTRSWIFWSGITLSALAILFLLFDSVIKVLTMAPAVEATTQLGYRAELVMGLGLLEVVCLLIYIIPRTALLGAVLLTGYLGGAIATHVRNGSDTFSTIFPLIIGALVWGGLLLRDAKLRTLFPVRR
ncbi:MAG: DoxX family protein [Caldilineaceae bacterium]